MTRFIVSLVGGASLGGIYALIGLGLVMAFRATGTFNLAYGQLMAFPAFIFGFIQANHSLSFFPALLVSLLVAAVLGILLYVLVLQGIVGQPLFTGLIATLGFATILDAVITLLFGSNTYSIRIPGVPTGVVTLFGARISGASLTIAGFTLLLAGSVAGAMRFTPIGHRIRAAGQDPILASQGGIHVRRIYLGSWALAAVLAGIAGITYGSIAIVTPSITDLGLFALPAIMIGGLDSIEGSLIGGLFVGIVQGFSATYLGGQYTDVITYSLLLAILLVRPQGLFGTERVTRV